MDTQKHPDINHALLAAKQQFKPLKKSGKNPHFKNEYSTLDDIREATLEALTANGIIVVHSSIVESEYTVLVTSVVHAESSSHVQARFFIDNDAPQKMGSAMTYGRRYNIVNLLDLIADPDDDAESYYGRGGGGASKATITATSSRKGLGKVS